MAPTRRIVVTCCVCKRVRSRTGRWYRRRSVPDESLRSHTYCPRCEQQARTELLNLFGGQAAEVHR
ncbi:MAG: hypothetical protein ACYTGH_00365 [Planctomycetota bacterium]|jgi:hypothetical protein